MSSSTGGGGQQFWHMQRPTKVLHLRNLPRECTEEDLVVLCQPFGHIVGISSGVGTNRNQAFVEFTDVEHAVSMVSHFASSSEPAKIRGKAIYIQYSKVQETINNKNPGEIAGNVLLVTIEGVQACDVNIDTIYLVFSAFGNVHKVVTFEKAAEYPFAPLSSRELQPSALIQYTDAPTASKAMEALNGKSIPSYMLPKHIKSCCLRIIISAHTDLNIKFQSHRSRDYTNLNLPVNSSAIDSKLQPAVGTDGRLVKAEGNVLLASIENMQYAVTLDTLYFVFSQYGEVQKIAIFEKKSGGTQALIQYANVTTATVAKKALEGHCIYDGGYGKIHLSYSRHTDLSVKHNEKSRDFTIQGALQAVPQSADLPATSAGWQGNPQASGSCGPHGIAAQNHTMNGQVRDSNPGSCGYPQTPGGYPGQMY